MEKNNGVSMSVVRRLPRYYRFLESLLRQGTKRISSHELSDMLGLTASQIRQDFNCFGGFGQQGYGYNVEMLYQAISGILGLHSLQKTILIGAGNLGRAILSYTNFKSKGFELIGVFDNASKLIGHTVGSYDILHTDQLHSFCNKHHPTVAILCIPQVSAEQLAPDLIALGIKGFWNFSHFDFSRNFPDVAVENVHLSDHLMTLSYKVNHL